MTSKFTFGTQVFTIDTDGTTYLNGQLFGKCDVNTGRLYNTSGAYTGTISPDGGGGAQITDAAGTVIPSTGSYTMDTSAGTSGTDGTVSKFTFGDQTFDINSAGTVFVNNEEWGTCDLNTGTLTSNDGVVAGTISGDSSGNVSLIKQDNTTIQGTYTAPTSPVTSPVLDIPKEGIKSAGETTSNLTGIHWTSPVASALQEPVIEGAKAIPGLVAQAGTQAQDAYANMMRQAMGPEQYQKYINKLAQKNILQSSVAENVLSNAQQQTARSIADKAYQSKLAGTQAQIQAPGQLSGIIGQLGGTEAGTTRIGATKDPLEPYKVVGNLL